MARQLYVSSHEGDARRARASYDCALAPQTSIPNLRVPGRCWAWSVILRFMRGTHLDNGLASHRTGTGTRCQAAEAHAIKARILSEDGHHQAASAAIDAALRLDPQSYEVNRSAGYLRLPGAPPRARRLSI